MLTRRKSWLIIGLVTFLAMSLALSGGAVAERVRQGEIDMSALSLPLREIRDVVPFGKDDLSFGAVTEPPDDIAFPPATPIQVRLLAVKAPKVNEAINVRLEIYASQDAPGTTAEIQLPPEAQVLDGITFAELNIGAGQTEALDVTIVFAQEGEQTIQGLALRPVSEDEVWGDLDQLFFTVGSEAGFVGLPSADEPLLETGQLSDAAVLLIEEEAAQDEKGALSEEEVVLDDEVVTELDLPPGALSDEALADLLPEKPASVDAASHVEEESGGVVAQALVDITICWVLGSDRDGTQPPFRDAYLKLVDEDTGADDTLWTGYTGYTSGCRTVTIDNADTDECCTIDPYFQVFTTHSGRYRVQTYAGGVFGGGTTTQWNVSSDHNFGTWWIGGGSGNDRSVRIYNDITLLRRYIYLEAVNKGMGGNPGYCRARWQTGGTDGTYYSLGDTLVHLDDADSASRDTVTHECAHRYMHYQYGGWTAGFDCPSPHYINGVSGKYCAWSEGYTYVLVAAADQNPVYMWPSGSTLNLETPNCSSAGWSDGARVEGRVGGVLIDLADVTVPDFRLARGFSEDTWVPACSGKDDARRLFDAFWSLFCDQNDDVFVSLDGVTNSFSNAWESRKLPRRGPDLVGNLNSISSFTHD